MLRRLRDSNPRYSYPYTNFPGLLLKPLGQVSNEMQKFKIYLINQKKSSYLFKTTSKKVFCIVCCYFSNF